MKVVKVINNNLIKSVDDKNNEILVIGCGLGFKKVAGDKIDESLIEKVYTCNEKTSLSQLSSLLEKIPLEHIQATNEIISFAEASLGNKLSQDIYITLADHINFAIECSKQGAQIKNALLWEIKKFYNHEFLVGKEALHIIKRRLGIELPEDEAGSIALYFVNALMGDLSMEKITDMIKMIQRILNIIKYHFNLELDESSIHYERFITHLKFLAQRIFMGVTIKDQDDQLIEVLKGKYKSEYECTLKVKDYVQQEFNWNISEDEMIYLTIHLNRITNL